MEILDSEYRLLSTPDESEAENASSPTPAAKIESTPLIAEKSTASNSALDELLSFVPACLRDRATLAFDKYILERFRDIAREMTTASHHSAKSQSKQNASTSLPSSEQKSTTSVVDYEKSESSHTSVETTMDASLDEKVSVASTVLTKNAEGSHASADVTTDTLLDEKECATPTVLENVESSCTSASATINTSLDEKESAMQTVLPGNTESPFTSTSATMGISLGDSLHCSAEIAKTALLNSDYDKSTIFHISTHSPAKASPPEPDSANEASQTIVLEDVATSSYDQYTDLTVPNLALLECADEKVTADLAVAAMNSENALYVSSDDEIADSGSSISVIMSDQNHHSLFSNEVTIASTSSSVPQSYYFSESFKRSGRIFPPNRAVLAQQFASCEDPAHFDLTHVLQQACLKVKDYRFDDDSSGIDGDSEPFDYQNGKHPDGWDVPDPRRVAEIIRELAMAHDEKGNWKTIEHWDDRPGFMYDSAHFIGILNWMQERVEEAFDDPIDFDTSNPLYISGRGHSPGTDWFLMEPLSHPSTKQANDGWTQNPENSEQTAFKASEALCQKIEDKQQAEKARRREIMKIRKESRKMARAHVKPQNMFIPRINMYLRQASAKDMQQVSNIYNHYVKNTPIAPDLTATSREDWVSRLEAIEGTQHLPFLVAICRSKRVSSTHRSRQRSNNLPEENIIGFSFAKQYLGYEGTYNGTVQMQTYVHSGHPHMGIGKNLTDKLIELLDISHNFHDGCDFVKPEDNAIYATSGGCMMPKQILVNIPFYPSQEDTLNWQKEWLWKDLYFDQVATMPGLGERNKKK